MIIFDSSVWIDHFKNRSNKKSDYLRFLILSKGEICVAPVIVQDVLQGFSDPNYFDVAHIVLTDQQILEFDPVEAAIESAKLYASLRKIGVTIRKPNDCLIAAFALHFDVELCHNDRDFDQIAAHTDLRIWQA